MADTKMLEYFIAAVIVLTIGAIVYYFWNYSTAAWSEWVLQGDAATCGSGINVYKRQCTVNSVVQTTIDACVVAFGGQDTKEETYTFANSCPVYGRYVILERVARAPEPGQSLHIAEIKIFDSAGNSLISNGITSTSSSKLSTSTSHLPALLIDGNIENFAHTGACSIGTCWFRIDLGSDKQISKVDIYNRAECCQASTIGTRVRIQNEAGQDVFVGPNITTEQASASDRIISFVIA